MLEPLLSALLLAASSGAEAPARASPARWTLDAAKSRIVVHVFKKGLFSALAHDHHFVPARWRAAAVFDAVSPSSARVEVTVAADSLADEQPSLSAKDRDEVNRRAAGPETLDAQRYPEIRFSATALEVEPASRPPPDGGFRGTLAGNLTLRGRERPLAVPVAATREGDGWRARGAVAFKQSDFGIRPFSGFAGTIAVRDEVKVEYDVLVVPAR